MVFQVLRLGLILHKLIRLPLKMFISLNVMIFQMDLNIFGKG